MSNVSPINEKLSVLEKGTNFLSGMLLRWLNDVQVKVNRTTITDVNANGDVAHLGAEIPTDLNSAFRIEVWPNNVYRMYGKATMAVYELVNAYYNTSNQWFQPDTSRWSTRRLTTGENNSQNFEYRVAANSAPLGVITWVTVLRLGLDGNLHLKTSSTIQYDL